MPLTLVLISDTHRQHREITVPEGDILIHAGDITGHGDIRDVEDFDDWLASLPHSHKLVIAGNHDFCFEKQPEQSRGVLRHATYLQDEAVSLAGLRFFGSPWQPEFFDWAFNLPRGTLLKEKWDKIPTNTDVLITHGPPRGHGDRTSDGRHEGCDDLLDAIRRIKPRLHVFGHIHEDYGVTMEGPTTLVNASTCTLSYQPANLPQVITLD
jgi:Icc-related predicted phosphoesterase